MLVADDQQGAIESPFQPICLTDFATLLVHSLTKEEDTSIATRINDLNSDTLKVAALTNRQN